MSRLLVFGLSGQIGDALLPRLLERDAKILAVSRANQEARPGVEWLHCSLQTMPATADDIATVLSLGPLDAFADWFKSADAGITRVIAISSTGRIDKANSPDPAEREIALRLDSAERQLFETATRRHVAATVLRPTLLYGNGRDQSVSNLVRRARGWGLLVLPATATGLRQPVHVADVADAIVRCLDRPTTAGRAFDLPGGETIRFDAMVRRAVERHAPGAWVLRLPSFFFQLGISAAALLGRGSTNQGLLARLQSDQVADASAARDSFDYRPRAFDP
jgi:nucleoside-diphosphate-sugar epimerase